MRELVSKYIPYHYHSRGEEKSLMQKYFRIINSRVLDAGCGDGSFFSSTFGQVINSVAIDIDWEKVVKAKLKYSRAYVVDIREDTKFSDSYFDQALCNSVLEHIDGVGFAIKELARISKSVAITVPTRITNPIIDKISRVLFNHRNLWKKEDWISMFGLFDMYPILIKEYNDSSIHVLYIFSCLFPFLMLFSPLFIKLLKNRDSHKTSVMIIFNRCNEQ